MHGMRKKQEPIYSCPTTETTIKWITEILSKIHLRFEKKQVKKQPTLLES